MTTTISSTMDLNALRDCMGVEWATDADARDMRDRLMAAGLDGTEVGEMPERLWLDTLESVYGLRNREGEAVG